VAVKQQTRRRLMYGSNATLVTAMVIAVLALAYLLADQYRARVDLTAESTNTLQPETVAKLALLDREGIPVEITAFTAQRGKDDAWVKDRAVKDLLGELDHRGQALSWRLVDFDKERLTAERLGVSEYGRVVLQRGQDRVDIKEREMFRRVGKGADRRLEFIGEAAISRGLSQLLTPKRKVVYVVTGHGELQVDGRGPDGLTDLVATLDQERFDVEPLDLLRTTAESAVPGIPDDAALLFLARPTAALTPQEEDIILAWVGRGGPLLVAVDVGAPGPALLRRMGVTVPDGVVLDKVLLFPYPDRPVPRYRNHPITTDLAEGNLVTVLAHPAGVVVASPAPEGVLSVPVLSTTRDGWIERGGSVVGGAATYDPGIDGAGPVDLAVALELAPGRGLVRQGKPAARVLVVADADAFTNAILAEGPGNAAFALNAVNWLVGEDERLAVRVGRSAGVRRLALTQEQTGTLRWVSLLLMPALVTALGTLTFWLRRGR
jgi:ABC-2 type transport system permease protein